MQTAGMIVEYDPLHSGHIRLMEVVRRRLGADTAIIGVMSGCFVQRGDFALLHRTARAKAAVESGMDLVLELPLPWAVASAERFADGGVQLLLQSGVTDVLAFGSERGDADALCRAARALLDPEMGPRLRQALESGVSFAAARQSAAESLLGAEDAALLRTPNNLLGVEYCKALLRRNAAIRPMTVLRAGAAHDAPEPGENHPSSSAIRALLRQGRRDEALAWMAPAMRDAFLFEEAAGRAPVFRETCERAILARLRSMGEADFAVLDSGREGAYHRLYSASRTACSVDSLLAEAKTKRYAYARLRRMVLWAYLGLTPGTLPAEVPYLRPLAANAAGRGLLSRMKKVAGLPILTKPADVRALSRDAQAVFSLEARAADLYALAYPNLSAAAGGSAWRERPVLL